ncbi:MAG: adenosylcobinamide-GDP ribazoletransferase [Rhodobacteraceae bacterium]|nr:MAG: adenosylcobinamide-GDP ribazoletransferase [Paracoccaceae bacterium]
MGWRQEAASLGLAVQFLTRLPTPQGLAFSEAAQARSMGHYPLVGLGIGALAALALALAAQVFPMPVAVLLSMAASLLITGALHEDGLADCADGLGGGLTRDRALEIMRDSRIGSYGVLSLALVLALKAATLSALPLPLACALLIAGHGLSRMAAVQVIARHAYARSDPAKFARPQVTPKAYRLAVFTAVLISVALALATGPGLALTALTVGALTGAAITRLYLRRLGGYTGDCLGATQQLAECGFYLGALAWAG